MSQFDVFLKHISSFLGRHKAVTVGCLYVALVVLAYRTILGSFFVSDDIYLISKVMRFGPFAVWSGPENPYFRPLCGAYLWLNYKLWGVNPLGFHLTIVVFLFCGTAMMLRQIVLELAKGFEDKKIAEIAGFLAGSLFIVWSSHGESVAWISDITDVLSFFFATVTVLCFLKYKEAKTSGVSGKTLAVTGVFYVLALLSKEGPVYLIPILPVLGTVVTKRDGFSFSLRSAVKEFVLLLLIAAAYLVFRHQMIGEWVGGYGKSPIHLEKAELLGVERLKLLDTFFPVLDQAARLGGYPLAMTVANLVLSLMLLIFAWHFPRKRASEKSLSILDSATIVGLIWLSAFGIDDLLWKLPVTVTGLVRMALTMLVWSLLCLNRAPLSKLRVLLSRLSPAALAGITCVELWLIVEYGIIPIGWINDSAFLTQLFLHISKDFPRTLVLIVWILWARPAMGGIQNYRWFTVAALVACALFAQLPTIGTGTGLDGQGGRFSYSSSGFAVMAIAIVFASQGLRKWWTLGALLGCHVALVAVLWSNLQPWHEAGRITASVAKYYKELPADARRVYVLSAH